MRTGLPLVEGISEGDNRFVLQVGWLVQWLFRRGADLGRLLVNRRKLYHLQQILMIKILSGNLCLSKLLVLAHSHCPPYIPSFYQHHPSLTLYHHHLLYIIRISILSHHFHHRLRKPPPCHLRVYHRLLLFPQNFHHPHFVLPPGKPLL